MNNWRAGCPLRNQFHLTYGIPGNASVAEFVRGDWWHQRQYRERERKDLQLIIEEASLLEGRSDTLVWPATSLAKYLVTRAWNELRNRGVKAPWFRLLWFQNSIPRHSFNSWLVMQNRLSTLDRFQSWGATLDPVCRFCKSEA